MQGSECAKFLTERIQNLKIAVIGDVMLDRYFYGDVKRITGGTGACQSCQTD